MAAMERFKAKLGECSISRPDPKAMERLVVHFSRQLELAAGNDVDPEVALTLYKNAQAMPGSTTRSVLCDDLGITLNGPWLGNHPHLIMGVEKGGRPIVLKMLRTHEAYYRRAAEAELHAVTTLGLHNPSAPFVRTEMVRVQVHASDQATLGVGAGERIALKMGVYVADLASLPQLDKDAIASGGARMHDALAFMHSRGLVHMDVKPGNILVDNNGMWLLSDFDSTTPVGQPVHSFTPGFYPGSLVRRLAEPEIDWGLLLVTLAILLDKDNLSQLQNDSGTAMDKAKVLSRCASVVHQQLSQLLAKLIRLAGW